MAKDPIVTVVVNFQTFLHAGLRRDLEDANRAKRQLARSVASMPSDDRRHLRVLLEGVDELLQVCSSLVPTVGQAKEARRLKTAGLSAPKKSKIKEPRP